MVEVLLDFLIDFRGTSVSCTDTDILKELVVKLDDRGPMKT